ncbi:hypothetical protein HNR23_002018 [Nocardiopsis mwathae]|uniref:Aminoglycoside phosphotransferase domain-containing protein n=1 Tax=Nocardiopsis mwathae TaxID=1472723 RepID=A0A7W9YH01_9ACTN|nr:phosphotransferase [Nocardiopsis mwathae]MBB6171958.1 hypothetical protein [Nocardiopsis mwathae]
MPLDDAVAARLDRFLHFTPAGMVADTGKALLVAGDYDGAPAVAKLLTDHAQMWRRRFAAETRAYEVAADHPPPVGAPRLLAADTEAGILILQHMSGRPAATERHPAAPLPPRSSAAVVGAADAVAAWSPPTEAFTPVFGYPQRFTRYGPAGYGLLTQEDVRRLTLIYTALAEVQGVWVVAHGDALPANIHIDGSMVMMLDWEWAGLYLPGWDHALLWDSNHDTWKLVARHHGYDTP